MTNENIRVLVFAEDDSEHDVDAETRAKSAATAERDQGNLARVIVRSIRAMHHTVFCWVVVVTETGDSRDADDVEDLL